MNKELWLAVFFKQGDNSKDMLWYNEGNASEVLFFIKLIWRRIRGGFKSKMIYKIRYGKFNKEFEL